MPQARAAEPRRPPSPAPRLRSRPSAVPTADPEAPLDPVSAAVAPGYAFEGPALELGGLMLDATTLADVRIRIPLAHGQPARPRRRRHRHRQDQDPPAARRAAERRTAYRSSPPTSRATSPGSARRARPARRSPRGRRRSARRGRRPASRRSSTRSAARARASRCGSR